MLLLATGPFLGARLPNSQAMAAQVNYVDQNHPNASDSNLGTEALPWRTIQHAADVAQPGDTIYVKSGTYDERVVVQTSGTADAKLIFRALTRRSVLMQGFYFKGADYVRVEGFRITNALSGWTEVFGMLIDGNHIEIVDNEFFELKSVAIQGLWGDHNSTFIHVANNRIDHSQMGIVLYGSNWVVEGNEITRLYNYGRLGDCDYMRVFGEGHVIRNNFLHDTDFNETGSAHVDCFQTFDNNGEYMRNVLIEGNTCYDFAQGFMGEASYHHNSSHVTFRNNIFAHGRAWGLAVVDIPYVTVENNTFYDIQYHGAGFRGDSHHNVVVNNIFYDIETSYWAANGGAVSGDHNLIFQARAPNQPGANDMIGVDPLLVDPANNDFHLQESSPAIDAGQALPQVTHDLEGKLRPQGTGYDIGAYEFGGAVQTFQDVPPEHWAHEYVEALYQQGYIVGCSLNPRLYCPERILNRAEEAVYVVRGVQGAEFDPLDPATPIFEDVGSGEWYYDWTAQLHKDGYTSGCWADPLRFCPLAENTVAEGCVFLLRMKKGVEYQPNEAVRGIFADVPLQAWYAPWVESCYDEGVLLPCQLEPQLLACAERGLDRAMAARMMYMAKGLESP